MKLRMLVVAAVACLAIPAMSRAQGTDTAAVRTPPPTPNGTECPLKCPSSKGAAGLTGVQFLALQQELRDRGCGNAHVTGSLDAPTRGAIRTCSKRLGVANNAAAVLAAFNVGFAASELGTSTGMGGGAMAAEGSKAEEAKESPKTERAEKRAASHRAATKMKMKSDTTMKKDTTIHS